MLPTNDGAPYMETFCGTVIASCDPNLKYAVPAGVGEANEIDKDWKLDYTIQFQNTGTDTAFLVVIKDTLSENLDLNTIEVRGGSHPFTWNLNAERELTFRFENILLPDSTTNEPRSHGLVAFSIYPKSDLLPGDSITNRVGIYFDFNEAVITNTVLHTIRKPVVISSSYMEWCAGVSFDETQIWRDTSIQILTEFLEYDSVHFLHLDVSPEAWDTISVNVTIGDYFENVLINADTLFTVSYENSEDCDSLVTYQVNGLTNANEISETFSLVKVFPNPVTDLLYVTKHTNEEQQNWSLQNQLGQEVWRQTTDAQQALGPISIRHLPEGIYWLKVKTKNQTAAWRIVKL